MKKSNMSKLLKKKTISKVYPVTFSITAEQHQFIQDLSVKNDLSISKIIRQFINEKISELPKPKKKKKAVKKK